MAIDLISYAIGKKSSGGSSSKIIAKSITTNGTYNASVDNADGYSPVTVNVGSIVLPAEYQRVKYISVTGTQYANVPTSQLKTKKVKVSFTAEATEGTGERGFAGNNNPRILELYFETSTLRVYDSNTSKTILENTSNNIIYSGVYYLEYYGNDYINIGLYRTDRFPFTGKLYEFAMEEQKNEAWENPTLVPKILETAIHLIPCYRKSDNEPGFYDLINDAFYTNVGIGEFGLGPEV